MEREGTQVLGEASVFEEIGPQECLELVGSGGVGRIAFCSEGESYIFPVNYVRDGSTIAFRTDTDTHLFKTALSRIAFEVDGTDPMNQVGWSVLLRGTGRLMTEAVDELSKHIESLDLVPWVPGDNAEWIRIIHPDISGRRITRA